MNPSSPNKGIGDSMSTDSLTKPGLTPDLPLDETAAIAVKDPPGSKFAGFVKRLPKPLAVFQSGYLYYRPLSQAIVPHSPAPEGIEFRQVTQDNLALIAEWKGEAYARWLRRLLNRGYVGMYGILGGRVVSQSWGIARLKAWSPACWHEPIEVGEVMLGHLETRPEYRRMSIALNLRAAMRDLLVALYGAQVKRTCGAIRFKNLPSLSFQARLKNLRAKEIHTLIVFGHLYLSRVWDLAPDSTERLGHGRFLLRVKIPNPFFGPQRQETQPSRAATTEALGN